jgi:hypothetical protein
MSFVLNTVSVLFAVLAAILWFASGLVRMPSDLQVGGLFANPLIPELDALPKALKRQSRLSAWAAICAGVSAASQAVILALQN